MIRSLLGFIALPRLAECFYTKKKSTQISKREVLIDLFKTWGCGFIVQATCVNIGANGKHAIDIITCLSP